MEAKTGQFDFQAFGQAIKKARTDKGLTREQDKGKHYAEYTADREGGGSWKSKLKITIDTIIPQSKDFEDFLKRLEAAGHEIKRGKYISVRAPDQERFTRTKTLGADYTEDAITKRIAGEYTLATPDKKAVDLTFDTPDEQGADIDIFAVDTPDTAKEDKPVYVRPAPAVNLI